MISPIPLAGTAPVGDDGAVGSLVPWLPVALLVAAVGTALAMSANRRRRRAAATSDTTDNG